MSKLLLSLAVRTSELNAAQVTEVLGCAPDHSVVKGSSRTSPTPLPPDHGWFLDRDEHDGYDPVTLLEELLDRASGLPSKLRALRLLDPSTEVTVHISITPFSASIPFYFPLEAIKALSALEANLDLDFFESGDV